MPAVPAREGEKLFLKGEKCFPDKCAIERRNYRPGSTGRRTRACRATGVQLREKQKVRRIYGLLERPVPQYVSHRRAEEGHYGQENLLQLLESRLDTVVYRMGFGASRTEARQVVLHHGIMVNGRRVNVPFVSSAGRATLVEVAEKAKNQLRIKAAAEAAESRGASRMAGGGRKRL